MYKKSQLFFYDYNKKETLFFLAGKEIGKMKKKPIQLMNQWCLENGSTLEGRMKSFRYLVNIVQKPPIMISEKKKSIIIPTTSIHSEDCIFINYQSVLKVQFFELGKTKVIMKDSSEYIVLVDVRTLRLQMKRITIFLDKMRLQDQKFILFEIE